MGRTTSHVTKVRWMSWASSQAWVGEEGGREVFGKSSLFAYGRATVFHALVLCIAFIRVLAAQIYSVTDHISRPRSSLSCLHRAAAASGAWCLQSRPDKECAQESWTTKVSQRHKRVEWKNTEEEESGSTITYLYIALARAIDRLGLTTGRFREGHCPLHINRGNRW